MIKGNTKQVISRPEKEYRSIQALNCSMIKLFDSDPIKFFEQFKLGKPRPDNSSISTQIGDVVDYYILECRGDEDVFDSQYDEKFSLFEGIRGKAQVFDLADILYKITKSCSQDGEIKVSFDTRFSEAYEEVKNMGLYKGKSEDKTLEDFNEKGYDYYQHLLDNSDKKIIDIKTLEKAKKVAKLILKDPFTSDLFKGEDVEFYPKLAIEWKYKGMNCKSEIDMLTVDHQSKKIYLRDLKTNFDNENFEFSYLKLKYYLQGAFYHLAVEYWARENGMEYEVIPMEFVVGDTSVNNRRPIRFQSTKEDLMAGLNGWEGHRGIYELIDNIIWAEENNIWNISKKLHESKGITNLKIDYGR